MKNFYWERLVPKSIALKLWAGMMTMVLVILMLLWFFQIVFLDSFYADMKISDIKTKGLSIISGFDKDSKAEVFDRLDALAFENNLSIELLDSTSNSLYETGSAGFGGHMPMMNNSARVEVFQNVMEGKEVEITLSHPRFGNKFVMIGLPMEIDDQLPGVFIINMPLAPVEDTVAILKRQLLYITPILFIASLLISFGISRSFIRPILEIKNASEKMAAGDFSVRIKTGNQDEIGRLAGTINHLGQQLSKIEQLRKDLIANVSHELRTPLSIIRGYAEAIRDITGNNKEKRENQIEVIIDEAQRLGEFVDEILDLSQLQAGYFSFNKKQFLINKVVDNVVNRFAFISTKKDVQIVRENSGDVLVEADQIRIEQVLYNLIINGFNHTPTGGLIKISIRDIQNDVRIEISDTGTGIKDEDIPYIWDRYFKKAKKDDSGRTLGTGLGLAIVKSILDAHNVSYGVESKNDLGTTFWFELKKVIS